MLNQVNMINENSVAPKPFDFRQTIHDLLGYEINVGGFLDHMKADDAHNIRILNSSKAAMSISKTGEDNFLLSFTAPVDARLAKRKLPNLLLSYGSSKIEFNFENHAYSAVLSKAEITDLLETKRLKRLLYVDNGSREINDIESVTERVRESRPQFDLHRTSVFSQN